MLKVNLWPKSQNCQNNCIFNYSTEDAENAEDAVAFNRIETIWWWGWGIFSE